MDRWDELDAAGSGCNPMTGFCEHGNGHSGSTKKAVYCLKIFSKNILHHGVSS
jgi:hypothetical protein